MFDFDCPICQKRQLISPGRIIHLINDDEGIAILFTCWCGTPSAIRTGDTVAKHSQRHALRLSAL